MNDLPALIDAIRQEVETLVLQPVDADTALISSRLLDSISLVDLALQLETRFGTRIAAAEIKPEQFETCRAIAQLVWNKLHA
ncbi:phosphopantetheine-binding protein [Chitinimonas koreensis]|uniref:phosphopantetheine-binding protein n=1 Tax=Chitinimonas koreensis TaxID=356302 RepID=UPI000406127F|nr:phosphopantetheine-binding protein [Chitinimonas koreensis]QNM97364.1 hypothetical protein H9L41_03340 [Chitinimonas koreensis]